MRASPSSTTISPLSPNAISAANSWRRKRSPGSSASPRSPGSARSTTGSACHGRRARGSRKPARALPAVEHLLADKPSHLIAHDAAPLGARQPLGLRHQAAGPQGQSRRNLQSVDPPRHAHRGRALPHQRSHRADHHHAGGAALPEASAARPGMGRRASREDGRHRLSARVEARPDEHSRRGS